MEKRSMIQRAENLPVGAIATSVGAATLANVYMGMSYTWLRHITMVCVFFVLVAALIKVFCYNQTFRKEYQNVVPGSLYATITMLTMILAAYIFPYVPWLGKGAWFAAVVVHMAHILYFTYRNVLKGVKIDTFVPSWFVTYNGLLVSTVVGGPMNQPILCKGIVIYGIIVFVVIIPFMVIRMVKKPVVGAVLHTRAIVLAPSSLCLVGYLNFFEKPNKIIVYLLYTAVFLALVFILINLPKFFAGPFNPGFAGLTFPMAIGIVASTKMSAFLVTNGMESLGNAVMQLQGIQIYLTTAIIAFVALGFLKMLFGKPDQA